MQLTISISPKKIAQVLTVVVIFLVLASVAGQYSRYVLERGQVFGLVQLFNVDEEQNIPTWYSSCALLLCSALLAAIAGSKKIAAHRYAGHWRALSLIFLYLSIDEAASIHEKSVEPLRSSLNTGGFLHFSWVILGFAFVVIVLLAYWRFLLSLPSKTKRLFFIAGGIYLSGTLGMELIGGYYADLYGENNLTYALITHVEELLEMMGIVLFIYTLLSYMRSQDLIIRIGKEYSRSLVGDRAK